MQLKFPPLSGGTASGLNDAGIETFEGDYARNAVRECAQNSLDAALSSNQTVELRISRVSLSKNELEFLPSLVKTLNSCRDYWSKHEKAKKFFTEALALTKSEKIDAIKISDFGTTGVDGDDTDTTSRWFGLVKSRGVSNQKNLDSGGAFGIGKDAPLAGSAFRTVLYSTKTIDGDVALQGVCRLVTHLDSEGTETQGTGFIGQFDSKRTVYRAIREPNSIPATFLRGEPGLDVWIIGSKHLDENWAHPFIRSALANFWPAVAKGKVTFKIDNHVIDQNTLGQSMRAERFDTEVADAWPYYLSLVDSHAKKFEKSLPTAGECKLHLLLGQRDLPKRICMVRKTGMVIETFAPRVGFLPFSGLFVCEDPEGNRLLKILEPPRHDEWDEARSEEEPRAKKALKEIKEWIRNELKNQTPHANEDEFNETEVPADLLEDVPENPIADDSSGEIEPDLGGNPKEPPPPQSIKIKTRTVRNKSNPGGTGTSGEEGDVEDPEEGDGKKSGGRKGQKGETSGTSNQEPRRPNIAFRSFHSASSGEEFEIVIRSEEDYSGNLWIEAVGDDGSAENVPLSSADVIGIGPAEVEQSKIKDLNFSAGTALRLRVRPKDPGKYALRVTLA